MSDKRSWFPTEETLTESMPTDYCYNFFRQYPNAANVRSKQVWNISKIIYILIRYLHWLVLCDRHISKNFINIKSFHLHNNPVKSLLLLVSLCRWTNQGTERLRQLLENTQQKMSEPRTESMSFTVTLCCLPPLWSQSPCTPSRLAADTPASVLCYNRFLLADENFVSTTVHWVLHKQSSFILWLFGISQGNDQTKGVPGSMISARCTVGRLKKSFLDEQIRQEGIVFLLVSHRVIPDVFG